MRRATTSITSNIAEGYGRSTYPDKVRFYYNSLGSLLELKDQVIIANEVGYLTRENLNLLVKISNHAHKLLLGLIKTTKNQ